MKSLRVVLWLLCVGMVCHLNHAAPSVNASLIFSANSHLFSNRRALDETQLKGLPRTAGRQDDEDGEKLSLEKCFRDAECAEPRKCYQFDKGDEEKDSEFGDCDDGPCYCFLRSEIDDDNACDKNKDCDNDGILACMKAAKGIPRCIRLEVLVRNGGADTSAEEDEGSALSLDSCKRDSDCRSPRRCYEYEEGGEEEDAQFKKCNDGPCYCLLSDLEVDAPCAKNKDCGDKGIFSCAKSTNDLPICVRLEVLKGGGGGGGAVCVATKHLKGFGDKELVFETHQRAAVLCDEHGSCATPGHMVVWKGQGMMMRRYCESVGCVPRVMMVNSPRLRRRVGVPSESEGLTFSAFAARYETTAEEVILSGIIRAGF